MLEPCVMSKEAGESELDKQLKAYLTVGREVRI